MPEVTEMNCTRMRTATPHCMVITLVCPSLIIIIITHHHHSSPGWVTLSPDSLSELWENAGNYEKLTWSVGVAMTRKPLPGLTHLLYCSIVLIPLLLFQSQACVSVKHICYSGANLTNSVTLKFPIKVAWPGWPGSPLSLYCLTESGILW